MENLETYQIYRSPKDGRYFLIIDIMERGILPSVLQDTIVLLELKDKRPDPVKWSLEQFKRLITDKTLERWNP